MHNFTIKSIRPHFHKIVTLKAPYKRRFVSLPLQSTLQLLVINITFHSLRLLNLAGLRPSGLFNHSHSFSLKIGNERIFWWGPLGAPFGRGPIVFQLRCPRLRYATGGELEDGNGSYETNLKSLSTEVSDHFQKLSVLAQILSSNKKKCIFITIKLTTKDNLFTFIRTIRNGRELRVIVLPNVYLTSFIFVLLSSLFFMVLLLHKGLVYFVLLQFMILLIMLAF